MATTLTYECSFGGVPFNLPTAEIELHLNGSAIWLGPPKDDKINLGDDELDVPDEAPPQMSMPTDDLRFLNAPRTWPGPGLVGITFPLRYTQRPTFKLNQFYYPTGCCRWSEFHGILDQDSYNQIVPLCFPDGSTPVPQTFLMQQGTNQISTSLYMLPPRPLSSNVQTPYYLISLVDVRWFWQYRNGGAIRINDSTTWAMIINILAGALGITWANPFTPESVYAHPHPFSDLYSNYENAAVLMDAALANIGRKLVRNLDGTFDGLRNAQSDARETSNQTNLLLAGGALNPPSLLPAQVLVTFPLRYAQGLQTFVGTQEFHIPFNRTEGDVWTETISLSDCGFSYSGAPGIKTIHDTGDAWVNFAGDIPINESEIKNLAVQLATDYYNWELITLDQVIPGVYPWQPEANNDVTWYWDRNTTWTRIQRTPYNYEEVEFLHHFPLPVSSSSSAGSSSAGSETSGASSSGSSGSEEASGASSSASESSGSEEASGASSSASESSGSSSSTVSNSFSGSGQSSSQSSAASSGQGSESSSSSSGGCPAFVCDVRCVNGFLQVTKNPITEKLGDLIVNNGAGFNVRLPVGLDGQVLTARSTAPSGVDWEDNVYGNATFDGTATFNGVANFNDTTTVADGDFNFDEGIWP